MKYAYGHIPDHANDVAFDVRHKHVGLLLGTAPVVVPSTLSYAHLMPAIPNQGATSSCVGQSMATSLFLRAAISGHPIERPSAKGIYDVARYIDAPHEPLVDEGSRPTAAMRGVMDFGIVGEKRWPLTDANVNDKPPLDVLQNALDAIVTGYYRIPSGPGSAALIRQALAKGFIPIFAMNVDELYEELRKQLYTGPEGKILGGHMQAIGGYGPGHLDPLGSWGEEFADGGSAHIADAFFESGQATDILVPTIVPTVIR